jgi:hypothetical protein
MDVLPCNVQRIHFQTTLNCFLVAGSLFQKSVGSKDGQSKIYEDKCNFLFTDGYGYFIVYRPLF